MSSYGYSASHLPNLGLIYRRRVYDSYRNGSSNTIISYTFNYNKRFDEFESHYLPKLSPFGGERSVLDLVRKESA